MTLLNLLNLPEFVECQLVNVYNGLRQFDKNDDDLLLESNELLLAKKTRRFLYVYKAIK